MIYCVIAFVFVMYLELLGRAFLSLMNKELDLFGFPVGFILLFASTYIGTSILTAMDCSFYIVLLIYVIIIILSFIVICIQFNKTDFTVDYKNWTVLLFVTAILLYFSYNTSLGDLNGFDTTHYLNMVTTNMGIDKLNSKHVLYGIATNESSYGFEYKFQTYYYFISAMMYVLEIITSKIGIYFYASTAFVWVFQIIFDLLFSSLVLIALNKHFKNKHFIYIFFIILFVFCYGKMYFNNVFGFYGNSIRTIIVSYGILYCFEYLNNKQTSCKILFLLSLLCACSLSSTAVFNVFFMLFALFFVFQNENKLYKEYGIIIFYPCINLLTILTNNIVLSIILSLILSIVLYLTNDLLNSISSNKYFKPIILIISFILTFSLSYLVTRNVFDFTAFFYNLSERADMTLDYFDYSLGWNNIRFYKLLSLLLLLLSIIWVKHHAFVKYALVLILVFFNPFCCSILNRINIVYYRSYELILNPYTIIFMSYLINTKIKNKNIFNLISITLFAVLLCCANFTKTLYWHESFEPKENYNNIYKMSNNEIDIIKELENDINYKNMQNPKIVTTNILTQSYIPKGEYFFGRNMINNENWNSWEYQIYAMFYPSMYYGDESQPENADYDNMCLYIKKSNIDYIVQDKNKDYYDKNRDVWYSMVYKINECGVYPFYENDDYALYYFGEQQ